MRAYFYFLCGDYAPAQREYEAAVACVELRGAVSAGEETASAAGGIGAGGSQDELLCAELPV